MKIIYFGKGVRGEKCLQSLIKHGKNVVGVVIEPEKDSPVEKLARKHKFLVYEDKKPDSKSFIEEIKRLRPDLFILAGYTRILKKDLLLIPKQGVINLHGGKLPEYRGVAPINWQIINGETRGGCSIIYVDEGIDTGDIIAQASYDILPADDAAVVLEKTLEIFPKMLIETLEKIESRTARRIAQNPSEGCYYTRRYPRDGKIDWKVMGAIQVHNLVRALVKPYPGAFTYRDNTKIMIWSSSLIEQEIKGIPGRVVMKLDGGVAVIAADKGLLIERISIEGSDEIIDPRKFLKLGDGFV